MTDRFSSDEEPEPMTDYQLMVFREGARARCAGKSLIDNPYQDLTISRRFWGAGWIDQDQIFISEAALSDAGIYPDAESDIEAA